MNFKKRKIVLLLGLAVLMLCLTTVALAVVYLAEIEGPPIDVTEKMSADIQYSHENLVGETWTLSQIPLDQSWYARMKTTGTGYAGDVLITWVLQWYDGSSWSLVGTPIETTCTLSGLANQILYTSSNGEIGENFDFGSATTTTGTYRVYATIEEYTG